MPKSQATTVIVESVLPLESSQVQLLLDQIELGKSVRVEDVENRVNPQLLAGIRVHVGDATIDMSFKSQLDQLQSNLLES